MVPSPRLRGEGRGEGSSDASSPPSPQPSATLREREQDELPAPGEAPISPRSDLHDALGWMVLGAAVLVMGDDWAGKFDHFGKFCEVKYLSRTPEISSTMLRQALAKQA